ncbi:transcriptional regulator [Spirochaetia bacterium]|nr:transcriptional regulator [Spirochaetia bacterium]
MNSQKTHIGSHIRKLRKLQQRTLQDVADTCGYTKSLLSKIESGKVVPPIATLVKIASALNTNIAALMAEGDNIDCIFVPARQKGVEPVPTESGYFILPLAVELKKKKMQPFIFTIRAEDLNDKVHSHLGEEFIYMLEGKMEFQVGLNTYRLKPGDSLFFESARDHRILNVLSAKVKYLDIFN